MVLYKKAATLFAAGALVLSMAACSSDNPTPTDPAPDDTSDSGGEGGGLITIIVTDPANPYWKTEGDVAAATAEELGYTTAFCAHVFVR